MIIERIKNKDDERLSLFYMNKESTLKNLPKYEFGTFIAESSLVIERALDKGFKPLCFLIVEGESELYKNIFDRCNEDIVVYETPNDVFQSLKGFILIKGIIGIFERKEDLGFENIISNSKRVVVLDEVVNPTNVGAIFRNAAALFADGVLLTNDTCDPLYRRSIRVSMGNVFNIDYAYIDKTKYIDILHSKGFKVVSFALRDNSVEIDDKTLNSEEKLAIVFGSEGYGLNKEVIEKSDYVVKIAMSDGVDSLNVASSSGIALYQLCKENKNR